MSSIFNVKEYHYQLPEIQKYMDLEPMAPETHIRQKEMHSFWNQEKNDFYARLFWPINEVLDWKLARLQVLVDWAYETSPFYRELYSKIGYHLGDIRSYADFSELPTISKDDVIHNFPEGMPSKKYDINHCRWMSSSGSSGKQVQIILPQRRANLDILFKYRMFEFMAGSRLDPNLWLYNIHYVLWWHTSILGELPVFSITQDCDPKVVLDHIKLIRPQVISSIGSYLGQLAGLGEELSSAGVKLITTNSETTSKKERKRWSSIFSTHVLDEYSSEELDILAMECQYGCYHVNEDDSHLEIVNTDSTGLGEVIGTDLWNDAMPMIRYEQGDLAKWSSSTGICECGSAFRRLDGLHGRADQAFYSRENGKIAAGSLLDVVEMYFCSEEANISEFRIIQYDFNDVRVLYVQKNLDIPVPTFSFEQFSKRLEILFSHQVNVKAEKLTEIPKEKSYKRRTIINRMKT